MNFLDELRRSRTRPISVVHQFSLLYVKGKTDVFMFVEGGDDLSYFLPAVRRRLEGNRKIHSFICDGKRGVLETRRLICQRGLTSTTTLFFVDKDLDDYLKIPLPEGKDLFCTRWYSIENYLASDDAMDAIWTDIFRLESTDARKPLLIDKYKSEYKKFKRFMLILMAWSIKRRRKSENVLIGNLNLDKVVGVSEEFEFVRDKCAYSYIRKHCGNGVDANEWRDVRFVCSEIRGDDPKKYIRGKFELWFFIKFVGRVEAELKKSSSKRMRPKNKISLTIANAVDVLAPRCATDVRLDGFLAAQLPHT